jgi:hypothetical protein
MSLLGIIGLSLVELIGDATLKSYATMKAYVI